MQTLSRTEQLGDYVRDRDQCDADLADEMFQALLSDARDATTLDDVFDHVLTYLTPAQRAKAEAHKAAGNWNAIGKLLCDVYEQLAHARASNVPATRRVISDEVR